MHIHVPVYTSVICMHTDVCFWIFKQYAFLAAHWPRICALQSAANMATWSYSTLLYLAITDPWPAELPERWQRPKEPEVETKDLFPRFSLAISQPMTWSYDSHIQHVAFLEFFGCAGAPGHSRKHNTMGIGMHRSKSRCPFTDRPSTSTDSNTAIQSQSLRAESHRYISAWYSYLPRSLQACLAMDSSQYPWYAVIHKGFAKAMSSGRQFSPSQALGVASQSYSKRKSMKTMAKGR